MVGIAELVTSAVVKKSIETIIGDIYELGKNQFTTKLKMWKTANTQRKLASRYRAFRMVKTIWQIDKAVDLVDFYHPSRIIVGDQRLLINDMDDFPYNGNIVVQGTVGQGKSILFRYLASREVGRGRSIPLFIELRRIRDGEKLIKHLVDQLISLGLESDEELVSFLAEQGKIVLFLDGFDEVKESQREPLISELEQMARRFEKLRVLVTSRPNSGIANSTTFRVFQLAPLQGSEFEEVIRKIAKPATVADAIIDGVRKAGPSVRQILDTPLMVALLVFRFNVDQSIPENTVAFYSDLFDLLIRRHDRSKAGYVRPRKTRCGDAKLHDIFNATCFLTRKADLSAFTFVQLQEFVQQALVMVGENNDASDVLQDIIDITCLILDDGGECKFLHRSVQEFHAARFISTRPDAQAIAFYGAMRVRSHQWNGELRFLEHVDRYRFLKHFGIPELRHLLNVPNMEPKTTESSVDPLLIARVYGNWVFDFEVKEKWIGHGLVLRSLGTVSSWAHDQTYDMPGIHYFHSTISNLISNLAETGDAMLGQLPKTTANVAASDHYSVNVAINFLLNHPQAKDMTISLLGPFISRIQKKLTLSEAEIARLEDSANLFNFASSN